MSWNYRVVEHETYNEIYEGKVIEYQIHEVYYDEHGENQWMTREACAPYGDTAADLAENFRLMQQAFERPVLKATVFDTNWDISEGN
tara:strand:+ start:1134 stop:1394 length:261 start_codon:yes stop_codon:yes gene_type:complete